MDILLISLFTLFITTLGLYLFNVNLLNKANKIIDIQRKKIELLDTKHTIIINQLSLNMTRIGEVEKIITLMIASGIAPGPSEIVH